MDIKDLRLTNPDIWEAERLSSSGEVPDCKERVIANTATDKAVRKISSDIDGISITHKDDAEFLHKVGEYLLALKKLVEEVK